MVAKAKKQKSGGRKNHNSQGRTTGIHARKLQPARGAAIKPAENAKAPAAEPQKTENGFHKAGDLELPAIVPKAAEPVVHIERERSSYDGDTAIKLYLREIGQVKLLTPQEEIELAARIKKGDKKAREQMIKANLRLVVKIARDYEGIGLPLLDLISEGNIGLMKAVERFDPSKGGKLSTYGSWWIKQSIKRALANQSKTIRLPVHLVDKISKMRRTAMRLQEELGREPTDDELGGELGISASRVAQMRLAAIRPASLDAPIGDEDSNNFAEVVQDEAADTRYVIRAQAHRPHTCGHGARKVQFAAWPGDIAWQDRLVRDHAAQGETLLACIPRYFGDGMKGARRRGVRRIRHHFQHCRLQHTAARHIRGSHHHWNSGPIAGGNSRA